MRCKYCKQKISFLDWCCQFGKCFPCYDALCDKHRNLREKERDKQEKISEKYWKTQGAKK